MYILFVFIIYKVINFMILNFMTLVALSMPIDEAICINYHTCILVDVIVFFFYIFYVL